jgi:hypothetical protein|eukprot:COSAG01_NODE_13601_length_1561_cov_1.034884_2_plen_79_part_00
MHSQEHITDVALASATHALSAGRYDSHMFLRSTEALNVYLLRVVSNCIGTQVNLSQSRALIVIRVRVEIMGLIIIGTY